jgi:type I restriction enzyme S subunit
MRITNLSRGCIYPDLSEQKLVDLPQSDAEGRRTALQDGDILISITADIGIIGYVTDKVPKPAYINQHIACLRLHPEKADSRFQAYYLASYGPQRRFAEMTDVGAKSGINLTTVGKLKLLRPPLPEQQHIAEALSDSDALIESLEQLVTKKRHIKQGAMQELLTGKTRLPGFEVKSGCKQTDAGMIPEDWELERLAAICSMKSGDRITNSNIDQFSAYPCYGGNGLRGFTKRFTHDGRYSLIGRQGALCGNVLGVEGKFFASEHAIVVTASARTDIRWLTFVLRKMRLNQYSESSAQPGLSVSKLASLDVVHPPTKAEQEAIAAVLSDMDTEIAALEAKLAKTRHLKQGMMQDLLTGRIRLI